MTARESAKQHAEAIERLAAQVQQTRDPYQAAQLINTMRQETRQLSEDMARVQAEERRHTA